MKKRICILLVLLLTVCLVMMSALLLIQTQPLIQKGARHFQRKER